MNRIGQVMLWGLWGLGALSALVVVLSGYTNLERRIGRDQAPAVAAHGACGNWGGHGACLSFPGDATDRASLQRGAALYMQYCLGCHGMEHVRHERIALDLDIPEELYEKHLLYAETPLSAHVRTAMPEELAEQWFGVAPPDLSLVARSRGAGWLYTYLRAFYVDETRPWGYDNLVFPATSMPNVLAPLQGDQRLGCELRQLTAPNGGLRRDPVTGQPLLEEVCDVLVADKDAPGSMDAAQFERAVVDLTGFLVYAGEPFAEDRRRIGTFVLLFLLVFTTLAYLMYREYRKDYK